MKHPTAFKVLIGYLGLWQAGHLIQNARYFAGDASFPPPPAGGWDGSIRTFFDTMAVVDTAVALLCVLFVGVFFARKGRGLLLGAVALSMAMYACVLYDGVMILTGSWADNPGEHWMANITFLPVVALFGWTLVRLGAGRTP